MDLSLAVILRRRSVDLRQALGQSVNLIQSFLAEQENERKMLTQELLQVLQRIQDANQVLHEESTALIEQVERIIGC